MLNFLVASHFEGCNSSVRDPNTFPADFRRLRTQISQIMPARSVRRALYFNPRESVASPIQSLWINDKLIVDLSRRFISQFVQ